MMEDDDEIPPEVIRASLATAGMLNSNIGASGSGDFHFGGMSEEEIAAQKAMME